MNNKVGIYFAYWEREWLGDYKRYIDKVKSLGFDVLEVAAAQIAEMSSCERKSISEYAREQAIELTYCIGMPEKYDLASESESVRRDGMKFMCDMITAINEMGGDTLGGILYSCWPCRANDILTKEAALERSVASVREVCKYAEEKGVNLCMEVVNRFEQYLINTAKEGVEFVKRVGSPNCKLLLDSFHMNIEEDSIGDAIRTAGKDIGHFHIGENNRKTPGTGRLPWDEIFKALADVDYRGKIVMEPFVAPGGQVGRDIRIFRDIIDDVSEARLDSDAAASAAFVKGKLKTL